MKGGYIDIPLHKKLPLKIPALVGLIFKTCDKKKHNTYVFQNERKI